LIHFRLVKAGYGTLKEVEEMNVRKVIQALHYEAFFSDYEASYIELNRKRD
jgi:hypothetical protein